MITKRNIARGMMATGSLVYLLGIWRTCPLLSVGLLLVGAWYVPADWHEKAVYIAAWFVCLYGASATPERTRIARAMQKTE